jgi:hypothetical protein
MDGMFQLQFITFGGKTLRSFYILINKNAE